MIDALYKHTDKDTQWVIKADHWSLDKNSKEKNRYILSLQHFPPSWKFLEMETQ